jgi:NtrC-family two-component system response regulator AlgB
MAHAVAVARQVADSGVPILLRGERGTGKKTLATAIHHWSGRRAGPFVTVWCAALAPAPVERRLMQHVAGAATAQVPPTSAASSTVDGGTLFLDEIGGGNLPAPFQVRLLRYLEQHANAAVGDDTEIDARIIAASSRDLEDDVRAGRLREDLFFRLNVVTIAVPPLRERQEDVLRIADHFLSQASARHRRDPRRLSGEARQALLRYDWPGNLVELMAVLERAVLLSRGPVIDAGELESSLPGYGPRRTSSTAASLLEIERQQIQLVLAESATLAEAAARLGIDPATLWRKRKRYGLDAGRGGRAKNPERT